MADTVLSTIPGTEPGTRIVVALRTEQPHRPVVLRHESFSEAVGWFVQTEIELSGEQVAGLRAVLGTTSTPKLPRPQVIRHAFSDDSDPCVLSFEAARAVPA